MTQQDKKNIYNKLVELLTFECNTCLDKAKKEKILFAAFKLELIEYAETNNLDTVDDLWCELARLLEINIDDSSYIPVTKCNCKNGVCSLC